MASEPKKTDKIRETNGAREGRAVAKAVSDSQAVALHTGAAAIEQTTTAANEAAKTGAELVESVSQDIARASAAFAEKTAEFEGVAANAASGAAEQAAETQAVAASAGTEAVQAVAEGAEQATKTAAEAGQGFFSQSMKAAASWQKKFPGFGSGQQMLGATGRVLEIYRGASEQSSSNARALADTYMSIGKGFQSVQRTYIGLMERAAQRAASRPLDLMRCKSFEELARVQRDMYVDTLNYTVEATGILLAAANQATQEALKPLGGNRPAA